MNKLMMMIGFLAGVLTASAENSVLTGDGVADDTAAIQARLDTGANCVYLPPPAKEYVISKPLELSSGQELRLDRFTRIRLKAGVGGAMVVNRNWRTGDRDIAVTGGCWDYDNVRQPGNKIFSGSVPKEYSRDYDRGCIFIFDRVKGLSVKGVTFRNPVTYSCQLTRTSYFSVEDITFDFDQWNPKPINMDGIHLDGGCHHGRISNLRGTCFDDMVALNADDGICTAFPGEISDIDIDGLYSDYTNRGVRILSTGSPVRNVTVRNVHIATYRNLVAITHFFPERPARGVFGDITVRDCFVTAAAEPKDLGKKYREWPMIWVEKGSDVRQLVVDGVVRDERYSADDPTICVEEGASVGTLVVRNCRQESRVGKEPEFLVVKGAVGRLVRE